MIKINEQFNVSDAEPDDVWRLLADPHKVVECVQGAALGQEHEDGSFDGSLTVKFGPAKVTFRARVELELHEEERTGRVIAKGKDSQGGTRFRATMGFTVNEASGGSGSIVLVEGETELSGKLAGIVEAGAKIVVARMAADFANRLSIQCGATAATSEQCESDSTSLSVKEAKGDCSSTPDDPINSGVISISPKPGRAATVVGGHSFEAMQEFARKRLPKGVLRFIEAGFGNEVAMRNNRLAFENIRLCPRAMVGALPSTTRTLLFGREQSMPLAVAPTGAADMLWYKGEMELAKASAAFGLPFTVSARSVSVMETLAEVAMGNLWFQTSMWPEREKLYKLLDRVKAIGYEALVVSIDPVFASSSNAVKPLCGGLDAALHPSWLFGVLARNLLGGVPLGRGDYSQELRLSVAGQRGAGNLATNGEPHIWDGLRELRGHWDGPLIVKGILHPEDARHAVSCGVDGVIVSNHGGRYFDSAPASIEALPAIVEAIGHRTTVMIDSGVMSGADVIKALAMGARMAFVGRAPLYGLAASGRAGAERVFQIFQESMLQTMASMGCSSLEQVARAGISPHNGCAHQFFTKAA